MGIMSIKAILPIADFTKRINGQTRRLADLDLRRACVASRVNLSKAQSSRYISANTIASIMILSLRR